MRAGKASETARRVAAHRLTFERVPAPYGDPSADDGLAADVAGVTAVAPGGSMAAYLAGRTRFFDHAVVGALARGVDQVVIAAAGYDGRALRYAKPGVRWIEVDHPDTQRDKVDRLQRLGIDTDHVRFVAADFAVDDTASRLVVAGLRTDVASLFLCEGVAIYLERPTLESLMCRLRRVAGPHSSLAISLSVSSNSAAESVRRHRFRAAVTALGEPARTVLTPTGVEELLTTTGWRVASGAGTLSQPSDRARAAGLLVLEPS